VGSALEALRARLGEAPCRGSARATPAKAKKKVSFAFDEEEWTSV
jgi:hypothetical protein